MTKYRNRKTVIDGIKFDSKKEADYYLALKLLQKAGKISGLQTQFIFVLQDPFRKNGKYHYAIKYIADFVYEDEHGVTHVVDVKGKKTQVYSIKKRLFEKKYPHLTIEEV